MLSQNPLARHLRLAYIGFALCIAVLFDIFFWQVQPGLGFLIFVVLYVAGFLVLTKLTKQIHQPKALLLLIPMFIFSFDVVLYNNIFVHSWTIFFVAILLFVFSILLTLKNPSKHIFSFSQIPILRSIDLPFVKWSAIWRDLFVSKEDRQNALYKRIAIGIIVSVPILFIFGMLFARADAVFAQLMGNIFDLNIEPSTFFRIFRTFVITLFLGSIMYVVIDPAYILGEKKFSALKIDNTVVAIILSLVNVLFLIFVVIQVKYLFGSHDFVVQNNINFADYARTGFFQLAWVIGLAAAMLIIFYRSTVFHGSTSLLKILKIFFIIQVGVIALSALKRMNIYQDEFGYTVLRLYVEWFIYFAMIILAISAVSVGIDWKFRNFFYTCMGLGVIALCLVSSINVDHMIAKENVDRYIKQGKELDMGYLLFHLSIDAIPEVKRAFDHGFVFNGISNDRNDTKNNFESIYLKDFSDKYPQFRNKEYTSFSNIRQNWKEFNFGVEKLKNI